MPTAYKTRLWIAYLLSLGLVHKRTTASHFVYDYPLSSGNSITRPIIVEQNWDMIPVDHINRSLRVLGKTMQDFKIFIKSQHKGQKK